MVAWINTVLTTIVLISTLIASGLFVSWVVTVIDDTLTVLEGSTKSELEILLKMVLAFIVIIVALVIHDYNLFIKIF